MALVDEAELAALAARYETPVRWTRTLDLSRREIEKWRDSLSKRRGEVVFAIPRPNGRVLLHIKDFYPAEVLRLPSGGIRLGEHVADAAHRELREETGFAVALSRWLGVVEYDLLNGAERVGFVSYIFLTEEMRETPHAMDPDERIAEFRDIEWQELATVAEKLDRLPEDWRDWGRFRAIAHRMIYDLRFQIYDWIRS